MKILSKLPRFYIVAIMFIFLSPELSWSQKRIKPPKRDSKVKSVDLFVNNTFDLYHKVFVYDSLVRAGVEVPSEIEDELVERAEQNIDSLYQVVPDILDDISNTSIMKQAKATLNLNRANFIGTEEEESDDN